jgi:hypothetical protein
MRFLILFFWMISVVVRLLVVAAPFLYSAYGTDVAELKALSQFNLVYWGPVWSVVAFFMLFGHGMFGQKKAATVYSAGVVSAATSDDSDDGKHFDFMIPGTVAYFHFNNNNDHPAVDQFMSND